MDIPKTLFATMVKNARMDRHWTQEELAEKLGVSPTYLGDLERHKGTPSLPLFCEAMRLLNLSAKMIRPKRGNDNSHISGAPSAFTLREHRLQQPAAATAQCGLNAGENNF